MSIWFYWHESACWRPRLRTPRGTSCFYWEACTGVETGSSSSSSSSGWAWLAYLDLVTAEDFGGASSMLASDGSMSSSSLFFAWASLELASLGWCFVSCRVLMSVPYSPSKFSEAAQAAICIISSWFCWQESACVSCPAKRPFAYFWGYYITEVILLCSPQVASFYMEFAISNSSCQFCVQESACQSCKLLPPRIFDYLEFIF
uniref:Uncharacterized protein n=1 Tax=Spironucleus salmonicida TaxID=348837 RepID=V6LZ41_9EUKA|eukprot:EST49006.1 Hypothetical protein SS50377_10745 [Spironucleus salmonicida]